MGRNSKKRRDKKRASEHRSGAGWGRGEHWGHRGRLDARRLVQVAASAALQGGERAVSDAASLLEGIPRQETSEAVGHHFGELLRDAFEHGWQPAELARVVRRRCGPLAGEMVVTAMADDSWRRPGTVAPLGWSDQLGALGVERWWGDSPQWLELWARRHGSGWAECLQLAVASLAELTLLPRIETVLDPPSAWGPVSYGAKTSLDDEVLAKVRALLAKAESTTFEAEAESLTAKAQQLMARHSIDDALARASGHVPQVPAVRRVAVDDPYAEAKSSLLHVVAGANGVRSVWYREYAMMGLVGFDADLDLVEILFTSLLVQASKAMIAKGSTTDGRGRSTTRSFRQSFLLAYAGRIRERLQAASQSARSEAEMALGASLLPVLARRDEAVAASFKEAFPSLTYSHGPSATNREGWVAGRIAAETATLGPSRERLTSAG